MLSIIRHILMISYTIVCIVISLILMVLLLNRKLPLAMARTIWSPVILWICNLKLQSSGHENLDPKKTYIFMLNHLSVLDIPCAFAAIPHNLHFVAKKSLTRIPFMGWFMMATGMIFIDRSNRKKAIKSLSKAGKLIRDGRSVVVFPEGTRSLTGEIGTFRKGAFYLALNSGVDVVPVYLSGTQNCWKSGSMVVKGGAKVDLKIGKPISTKKYTPETISNFINDTKEKVSELSVI